MEVNLANAGKNLIGQKVNNCNFVCSYLMFADVVYYSGFLLMAHGV
jgi:hypothetical protein